MGTEFSEIYQKAFGICGLGERVNDVPTIECNYRNQVKWFTVLQVSGKARRFNAFR
ncbi:DUF1131 family protein [Providencia rettgeri]|uniref:DUF1131 family protein n=1 Tax=Providencia rettgeri TaxID=587 RepID=A0A939NH36_PRORE|nr:DUF1131 family protein [Providencia rettgeri]